VRPELAKLVASPFQAAARAAANPDDELPPPLKGKARRRRRAMVARAREILPHLPQEEGEATHALLTGRVDLAVVIVTLLPHYGPCRHARFATLAFNERTTLELSHQLATNRAQRLSLLCSLYFRTHNGGLYQEARAQAERFPGRWALAAGRNHAKVACLDFGRQRLVLESSANLRSNGNLEQFSVIMDQDLHDWYAGWLDREIARHEQRDDEG
jgi:hypothetical protein